MRNFIDTEKYIGISETPIPLSKFKKLPEQYKVVGNIFGFNPYDEGTQFYVTTEQDCIILGDKTEYVTEDQLEFKTCHMVDFITPSIS